MPKSVAARKSHRARRSAALRSEDREIAEARCSEIVTDGRGVSTLDYGVFGNREAPGGIKQSFHECTHWADSNWFVRTGLHLKSSFFNFGRTFLPADPSKKDEFKAWLKDAEKDRFFALTQLADAIARDWFTYDTLVAFYREDPITGALKTVPFLLRPEDCSYTDAMGIERLRVSLGYKSDDLNTDLLTPEEIRRYTKGEITIDDEKGEYFKVLTRGRRGYGFGQPGMRTIFRTLSQNESMEVGESQLAHMGRLVLRQHSIGFEVKAAALAARQAEFLFNIKRQKAIEKFFKGRCGPADIVTQFDHQIKYIMPDSKFYEGKKWETIINRLVWWAGPLGFMLLAKSVSPFLLGILRVEMGEERRRLGAFMESLINQTYRPPGGIRLQWSNRCFNDSRLAWDMVKALMTQGPLSLTTALKEADFNPEEEGDNKIEEARPENDKKFLPKFDSAHGQNPVSAGRAGRKQGQPDGGNIAG